MCGCGKSQADLRFLKSVPLRRPHENREKREGKKGGGTVEEKGKSTGFCRRTRRACLTFPSWPSGKKGGFFLTAGEY